MAANLQVQYAFITPSSSGASTVVGVQAGQRIIVLQCCVIASVANNVKFQSNGTTDISATMPLAANGGFVMPFSAVGWFQTAIGESLAFNQSTGASTGVQVVWCPSST
jgi:hypothetical protein